MIGKLIPEGKWSRITLLWSFSQFIVITIIECLIIYTNLQHKKYYDSQLDKEEVGNFTAIIVYQVLFIVALTYQLYLTVDTLLNFSTIDLIALAIFNTLCLLYSVAQYIQADKNNSALNLSLKINQKKQNEISYTYEYINIGIMTVYSIGWWYITFRLYKVFGWNVFKQIGADISLKSNNNLRDKVPIAAITVIGTILGFVAVAKKSRLCLGIYIFTLCVVMGFICYVYTDMNINKNLYRRCYVSLTVTMTLCLVTYGISLINFKNFGLGIPKSINKNSSQTNQSERVQQKRLSID
ncbi:hypothetical protein PIROE2DRAFT_11140 [Piromyces sp. E2]|nr:hypothetical protein PIROE2DRAFT_11140 [Piromyces sp. E2]|eukprot:OUM62557.1 hypothetical protein PIROE2DRAFT_11140 [Piromyces sp. E2]